MDTLTAALALFIMLLMVAWLEPADAATGIAYLTLTVLHWYITIIIGTEKMYSVGL